MNHTNCSTLTSILKGNHPLPWLPASSSSLAIAYTNALLQPLPSGYSGIVASAVGGVYSKRTISCLMQGLHSIKWIDKSLLAWPVVRAYGDIYLLILLRECLFLRS
jgi:hypothetical protein